MSDSRPTTEYGAPWLPITSGTSTRGGLAMDRNDDADDAMWTALETNDQGDWNNAIELARQADQEDPIPGASA